MRIACAYCGKKADKPAGAVNRAREWMPIETWKRGNFVIFYYPACQNGRSMLPAMFKVETYMLAARKPSHWMPLPEPPK